MLEAAQFMLSGGDVCDFIMPIYSYVYDKK